MRNKSALHATTLRLRIWIENIRIYRSISINFSYSTLIRVRSIKGTSSVKIFSHNIIYSIVVNNYVVVPVCVGVLVLVTVCVIDFVTVCVGVLVLVAVALEFWVGDTDTVTAGVAVFVFDFVLVGVAVTPAEGVPDLETVLV